MKNSQFVMEPMGSRFYSAIVVPGINFKRITTISKAMSKRFQGVECLNPRDNRMTAALLGETMAVDHIFLACEIVRLPGF